MINWFRKRRLSADARKRLLIVAARAEEALIETHVGNLLDMLDTIGDEIDLDRALALYAEMMSLDDSLAGTVANRLLARLETPARRAAEGREIREVRRRGYFRDHDE